MKTRRSAALAAAVMLLGLGLAACSNSSSPNTVASNCKPAHPGVKTITQGKLTIAPFDIAPYSKVDGSTVSGVDGDIINTIAKMECLSVAVKPAAPSALITMVIAGQADTAIGDWYRTTARAKVLNLSDPLYLDLVGIVSKNGYSSFQALKAQGKQVATVDGYLYEPDLKKLFGSNMHIYATPADMYEDLSVGRIDAAVDSYASATHIKPAGFQVKKAAPDPAVTASLKPGQTTLSNA